MKNKAALLAVSLASVLAVSACGSSVMSATQESEVKGIASTLFGSDEFQYSETNLNGLVPWTLDGKYTTAKIIYYPGVEGTQDGVKAYTDEILNKARSVEGYTTIISDKAYSMACNGAGTYAKDGTYFPGCKYTFIMDGGDKKKFSFGTSVKTDQKTGKVSVTLDVEPVQPKTTSKTSK